MSAYLAKLSMIGTARSGGVYDGTFGDCYCYEQQKVFMYAHVHGYWLKSGTEGKKRYESIMYM